MVKQKYIIHFSKEQLPKVKGFWSLTCYNNEGFLVNNPINRYEVGDRDSLAYNDDGSLDLYIQPSKPEGVPENNWLPSPKDKRFSLLMRMYWPKEEMFSDDYKLPIVTKVE